MIPYHKTLDPRFHVQQTPNKPAYIMANSGQTISYAQLEVRINRMAHLFRTLGLKRGDCVALYLENHPRYFEICWAALYYGLYIVLLDSHLKAPDVVYIMEDSDAVVLITSIIQRNIVNQINRELATLKGRFMLDGTTTGFESLEQTVATMPNHPIPDEMGGMYMLYTSGTTGRPKGVRRALPTSLSDTLPVRYGLYFERLFGYNESSIQLIPSHLYHSANINASLVTVALGGTVVVMDRFEPQKALTLIEQYHITHGQWVPWHFILLLMVENYHSYDVSSLKAALHTTAPCPVEVKEKMIDWWGPILYDDYGMTEGFGGCSITSEEWLHHRGSVGQAYIGTIHIVDEQDEELSSGEIGTIYFESDRKFEYYKNPARTQAVRNKYGWATVGDVGYIDEDGYLYVIDRKDDMINVGGNNVYPQEVESTLLAHPMVIDVGVIGVPSAWLGEEVKAFITLQADAKNRHDITAELVAFCQEKLPTYKCPTSITFVEQLPRTPIGKLQRRKLRENGSVTETITPDTIPITSVEQRVKQIWSAILNNNQLNPAFTFFENGGHSLDLVRMIQQVQQQFGVTFPLSNFLNDPTLPRMVDLIEGRVDLAEASLTQMEQDLRGESSDLDAIDYFPPRKSQIVEAIFLTGANGFVGIHLLSKLLQNSKVKIYCLIRGKTMSQAEGKLKDRLFQVAPNLAQTSLSQLIVIKGDLTKPNFELDQAVLTELCTTVDTIIHCGAFVHHLYGYEQLRSANVLGTQEIIRLASTGKAKGVYHISTLAAASTDPQTFTLCEQFPHSIEQLPASKSGYALTKFVAEHLIHQAQKKGLAVNIYRLGLIAGDSSDGIWPSKGDHFMSLLKVCLDLRVAPRMTYFIDWLPVDWLAQTLIDTIVTKPTFGKVVHFSNSNGIEWNELIQQVNELGHPVELIDYEQWKDSYLPQIPQTHDFYPLIPLYQNKSQADVLMAEPYIENRYLAPYNHLTDQLIKKYLHNLNHQQEILSCVIIN